MGSVPHRLSWLIVLSDVSAKALCPDYVGGGALSLKLSFSLSDLSLLGDYIWQEDVQGIPLKGL